MDPPKLSSTAELLGLALSLESVFLGRCRTLVGQLVAIGESEAAEALRSVVEQEKRRLDDIERRASALRATREQWEAANPGFDPVTEDEDREPAPLTLYRCLGWLVQQTEQRFKLCSYIAAHAERGDVRGLAEELAGEELSRAAGFRVARRRAYHEERRHGRYDSLSAARHIESADELRDAALRQERALAGRLAALAQGDAAYQAALEITHGVIDELSAAELPALTPEGHADRASVVSLLDRAFAFYDQVGARAADEAVMATAQSLAQRALERIKLLQGQGSGSD